MDTKTSLHERSLEEDLAPLDAPAAARESVVADPMLPDAYRLAFADPEFMARREARGIRFQLEMLKPDLGQQAHGIEHTVVVYGSARFVDAQTAQARLATAQANGDAAQIRAAERDVRNADRYENARAFARLVAEHSQHQPQDQRIYICTGGGPGIMEAANRGAFEAGADNVGLNILLPHEQQGNRYITPELSFKFHYFALRKMHFMMRAKALVAFPGGFGTMDELFEVLTLVQTTKVKPVPIILFDSQFWKQVFNFDLLVQEGMISPQDLALFHFVDTPQAAWDIIKDFYQLAD
ncbi:MULTISPECIES: TIGR00730 family Rossman fold protein [Comamonas]|uniref:Cytokinin riboside 5'-monophosphate phosphoribohydrolase n=1 Tax=Comamonas avium TaxID=2762231 RepID=A0ABR8SDB6_9BURK|nr:MULTISPECIES: TIGR00730 family Rossman fold protein [Comamonas]MBD7961471.1 TIGR00730 family Rossman fold protein [Comamonas avium]MBD9402052.1 TIGR00730 family Rossman fold protein [Comamonas sp. CMM02]